jgi:hypothetical protein
MKSIDERFWSKVRAAPANECWIWLAGRNSDGYGSFWNGDHNVRAHRWSYESLVTQIPTGLQLDHLCRVRSCVNPAHLEPVTNAENARRGHLGLVTIERAKSITHCPHGHEYTPENTIYGLGRYGKRYRRCRLCKGFVRELGRLRRLGREPDMKALKVRFQREDRP